MAHRATLRLASKITIDRIQSAVEPDMQARVFSLLSSVGGAMAPIDLVIAGPVADLVGIQVWFLLAGTLCIVMGVAGLFVPAVMNIENRRSPVTDLPAAVFSSTLMSERG